VKSRTFLALAGIVIGTAAVIGMLHIGQGARQEAMRQFKEMGTDFVLIVPHPHDNIMPEISLNDAQGAATPRTGLGAVAPMALGVTQLIQGRVKRSVYAIAATADLLAVAKFHLREGRFVSSLDGFYALCSRRLTRGSRDRGGDAPAGGNGGSATP